MSVKIREKLLFSILVRRLVFDKLGQIRLEEALILVQAAKYAEVVILRNELSRKAFFKKTNILYPQTLFLEKIVPPIYSH